MDKKFILTEEHLLLAENLEFRWEDCEFGAPAVDCKRPYGNSSVYEDIAEILGEELQECPHCGELIGELPKQKYSELHRDMLTVLEILRDSIFSSSCPEAGTYEYTKHFDNQYRWTKVKTS